MPITCVNPLGNFSCAFVVHKFWRRVTEGLYFRNMDLAVEVGAPCPCCPNAALPQGFEEQIEISDLVWSDDRNLAIGHPQVIKHLDTEMGNGPQTIKQLPTNFGCCSSFQLLSSEGIANVSRCLAAIEHHAVSTARIPKVLRGGTFRSRFLNGMAHSPTVLRKVCELAQCELIYHPIRLHHLHLNWKPDDTNDSKKRNVDRWHCDTTPFVLIVFCTDPEEYEGGELQYYNGTREEGTEILRRDGCLNGEKVLNVGRQEIGHAVFMQGSRVFHQVTAVTRGDARTTMVYSFQPRNVLALEACRYLRHAYNGVDPLHVFLSDWARYRAWKVARRMELCRQHWGPKLVVTENEGSKEFTLMSLLKSTEEKLNALTHTLPYTDDREFMRDWLESTIGELIEAGDEVWSVEAMTDYSDWAVDDFGYQNIVGGIEDIKNAADDILTLKDSSMEYF